MDTGLEEVFVVPYIGTWIETLIRPQIGDFVYVVPYIGTWIETDKEGEVSVANKGRTLYRYVDWNCRCLLRYVPDG